MPKLTRDDIIGLIPHRFENVLVDEVECTDAGASGVLTIAEGDPLGRDIFLRTDGGRPTVLEHALAEHIALVSLCQLGKLADGEVGFFSMISNFQQTGRLPAGEPIHSELVRERDRGAFRRFKGKILNAQREEVASAAIMAFIMDTTQAQPDAERKQDALPPMTLAEPVPASAYWWKRPEMCFVSECRHLDAPGRAATLAYTYPQNHPFTKGHFPGNPVMMGITQWAAASDAADWLAFKLIETGEAACPCDVSADVVIQKTDGTVVAEVSRLVNRYQRDAEGRLFSETTSTKRIGFRDMVRPGDELVYGVSAAVRH